LYRRLGKRSLRNKIPLNTAGISFVATLVVIVQGQWNELEDCSLLFILTVWVFDIDY
jgi:hypothetical protein